MSAARVLLVGHELRQLRPDLIARGFRVSEAPSGEDALANVQAGMPDIVLLDSALPGLSDIETCLEIRLISDVPIVFLSSCDWEGRKVQSFESGADDYIVKPFGMDELAARIRAMLRRAGTQSSRAIRLGNVEVDLESHEVKRSDALQHLTDKEFQLFHCLVAHAGAAVSHRQLLQTVWGSNYADEVGYLRVLVNQLRKKVEPNPARPKYIVTERYEGYRFVAHPELEARRVLEIPPVPAQRTGRTEMPPRRSSEKRAIMGKVITLP